MSEINNSETILVENEPKYERFSEQIIENHSNEPAPLSGESPKPEWKRKFKASMREFKKDVKETAKNVKAFAKRTANNIKKEVKKLKKPKLNPEPINPEPLESETLQSESLPIAFCPNCGYSVKPSENRKFCPSCGKGFDLS